MKKPKKSKNEDTTNDKKTCLPEYKKPALFDLDLKLLVIDVLLFSLFSINYYHPLSENRDFSGTKPPLDPRPVCKLKLVCCGPGEKKQSALSFSVEAWRPDEV